MNDVTRILSAIEQGDPQAAEQLLPLVYDELRKLAAAEAGPGEARADAPGHGPGPRGLPAAGGRGAGPALGQSPALLRRRRRGHAAHPGRERPPQEAAEARRRAAAGRLDLAQLGSVSPAEDLLDLDDALDAWPPRTRRPPSSSSCVLRRPVSRGGGRDGGPEPVRRLQALGLRPGLAAPPPERGRGARQAAEDFFPFSAGGILPQMSHGRLRTREGGRAMNPEAQRVRDMFRRGGRASRPTSGRPS